MTEPKTTTLTLDTAWIGEGPKLSDEHPHVTCQHRWRNRGPVLTSLPPVYRQVCTVCGKTRDVRQTRSRWEVEMVNADEYRKHDNADLNKLLDEIAERP